LHFLQTKNDIIGDKILQSLLIITSTQFRMAKKTDKIWDLLQTFWLSLHLLMKEKKSGRQKLRNRIGKTLQSKLTTDSAIYTAERALFLHGKK